MKETMSGTYETMHRNKQAYGQIERHPTKTSVQVIAYWAATISLAFLMIGGAYGELTQQWGTLQTHTILGYPIYFLSNMVLPWDMVDNSSSPLQTHFGAVFGDKVVSTGLLFPA